MSLRTIIYIYKIHYILFYASVITAASFYSNIYIYKRYIYLPDISQKKKKINVPCEPSLYVIIYKEKKLVFSLNEFLRLEHNTFTSLYSDIYQKKLNFSNNST